MWKKGDVISYNTGFVQDRGIIEKVSVGRNLSEGCIYIVKNRKGLTYVVRPSEILF